MNIQQIEQSQILHSVIQKTFVSEARQLEVPVTRDPWLIIKQEIDQITSSSTAEVFIDSILPATGSRSKDQHFEPIEEKTKHKRRNKNQGNNSTGKKHNINRNVPVTFTCSICDDVCGNELEFKNHLDFHMELRKGSDKDSNVEEMHERISLPEQLTPMIYSSSLSKTNPTLLLITETNNPDSRSITEEIGTVSVPPQNASQPLEEIASSTVLVATTIVSAESSSSSASSVGVKTSSSKSSRNSMQSSSPSVPTELSNITDEIVNMPSSSETSTQPQEEISESGVLTASDIVLCKPSSASVGHVGVETGVSKLSERVRLKTDKSFSKSIRERCRNLPEIPVLRCDCPLKKLRDKKCKTCSENAKYLCVNCNIEFNSHPQLKEHFAAEHAKLKFFCQECGHGHIWVEGLMRHQARHKGLLPCYRCTDSFTTKQEFEQHLRTHKIKCNQCDKTCLNDDELRLHNVEVHKDKTYKCNECSQTFNKYSIMRTHIMRYHRTSNFVCKTCGKVYHRLILYRKHMEMHSQEQQVICEKCGKVFGSVMYLKAHQQAIHLKKKHVCNVCKKEFSSFHNKTDCEQKHADIAPFKCNMCDKAYFNAPSLLIHKRIHIGKKPYLCFMCGRRFCSSEILFKHALSHGLLE